MLHKFCFKNNRFKNNATVPCKFMIYNFYPPIQDEYLGTLPESCNSYPKNRSLSTHCSLTVVFVMEAANLAMFPMTRTLLL